MTLAGVGGAQAYVAQLVPALVRRFDVVVAAHGEGPLRETVEAAGARYHALRWVRRAVGWRDVVGLFELAALFRRERAVAVHLNSSKVGLLGRVAAWMARVPVRIFTVHGWAFAAHHGRAATAYRLAERAARPFGTVVICPAQDIRRMGIRARTCDERHSVVIANAVDAAAVPLAAPDTGTPTIVSVGRLHEPKDFVTLARALRAVPRGQFRADIVGDGPDRPAVEAELRAGGLDDVVELVGERADVPERLAGAAVFVLSSRSECMPISVLEAMAAGLPVVASAVGGLPEMVVDGETGVLVPPGDPEALGRALARLVADPQERRRMGAAGRRRVEEHFDLPAFQAAHLELYRREIEAA
ncbi:MAG: glycosyltransferase [Actinomycetota bacterium]|nr:glycosyltransferase [Actinomycetota bacterium]